jgi:ubiquinone/menaquinone biosynthesis C-methylase UbiE
MKNIKDLFQIDIIKKNNVYVISDESTFENQEQTNKAFSDKWNEYDKENFDEKKKLFEFQKKWYLKLYGFSDEQRLKSYLCDKSIILDAGSGLGYKAKWFADLSPNSLVIGMDYSNSVFLAAKNYIDTQNLIFVKNDIANTKIKTNSIDYISCDQVLHHTEDPQKTIMEFNRILSNNSELAVYVYAKKALPRELIDDYFREKSKSISKKDMWNLSEQLTELGKKLSELKIEIDVPEISLLGIKSGKIDLQRFIYWNFLKCFWNEELGKQTSISTNYDWYSPSNAFRYNKDEFELLLKNANFEIKPYHSEEACHSGRFAKTIYKLKAIFV